MVTFRLIEEDEQRIVYWYFPEGKEDKGHGIIIVDKIQEEIDITEVAPDDFERDIPAEELNELAEAINKMKRNDEENADTPRRARVEAGFSCSTESQLCSPDV